MTKIDQKIPEGWSVKKLGDMGEFVSGAGFPESEQGGKIGIPFYKVSDMNLPENKNTMITAHNYVNQEQIKKLKYKPIKKEAIIFAKVGAAIFLERKRIAQFFLIDNNMMAFIPNKNVKFLKIILDRVRLSKYVQVGALPSYNASDLRTIKILLPPLAEQEKIAEILSCWDEGIEKLSALIEKKKLQKKALMQQLLTAKIRLPAFTDPWGIKKLGEIGTFVSGGTPDTEKAEYWNGDIVWLTPSEITKLKTRFVSDSERKITKLGLKNSSAVLLPKNSLIICTRATIGDCCINTEEVSTNQGFKNLIPNNNCTDFLYYLISIYKSDLIRRACGSTFLEISKHDIEKLKYVFPPLPEQKAIADILSKADEEIELLNKKLEAFKLEKKALMQKLLTGQIRVKVN